MITDFIYILGANLELHVTADVRFGRPAKIDALPEDCYEAEDDEVDIERVTIVTPSAVSASSVIVLDFEWDDIQVAGRWLDELLQEAAMESLA